eukprot:NP_001265584.1 uncharacterized protein LOC100506115 [Homo sapiens]
MKLLAKVTQHSHILLNIILFSGWNVTIAQVGIFVCFVHCCTPSPQHSACPGQVPSKHLGSNASVLPAAPANRPPTQALPSASTATTAAHLCWHRSLFPGLPEIPSPHSARGSY